MEVPVWALVALGLALGAVLTLAALAVALRDLHSREHRTERDDARMRMEALDPLEERRRCGLGESA